MKTVDIQVNWAAARRGRDRLPGVVTHPRPWRASAGVGTTSGSGVAIDWVSGRSYSLEVGRRLSVQSVLRKGWVKAL